MTALAVSGTGLYTPPQSISNEELVTAFNAYVRNTNAANAGAIAAGTATALVESSAEFIVKASGIKARYVVDKAGILDPGIMCPRLPERPTTNIHPRRDSGDASREAKPPIAAPTSTACSSAARTATRLSGHAVRVQDASASTASASA